MAATEKPKSQVFENETDAIEADLAGRHLYRLCLKGSPRYIIAAVSPQAAMVAYVEHLGGSVERMSDKDKFAVAQKALAAAKTETEKTT